MKKEQIYTFFERLSEVEQSPETELQFTNPFTLTVAVVLSAQATDKGVNRATAELFRLADTPEKMIALGEDRIRDLVKTIGLFRTKAKNVYLLSVKLRDEFESTVPRERDQLMSLPGVGRKTANVVMNVAFGEPTFAVDTHVYRLSNRTGLAPGKTVMDVEKKLEKRVPDPFRVHAHHWLILHGRYICVARKPKCGQCVVSDICKFKDKAG
ncbi:endonuclease III [Alphaproteobacteria bacterium]|nr:endonuclease III [Alphaproteobacteria bacterium]